MSAESRLRVLRVLLIVGFVESFIHYLDNTLRFRDYAGPNPPLIFSWIPQWPARCTTPVSRCMT